MTIDKIDSLDISDQNGKKNIFHKPTIEEVRAYCQERGNTINAEQFVNYYETIGWEMKKGQKMKDWKAAIRTWEIKQKEWKEKNELRGTENSDRVKGQNG